MPGRSVYFSKQTANFSCNCPIYYRLSAFFSGRISLPRYERIRGFFLLENEEDRFRHAEMGLSLPLEQSLAEFTDILHIHYLHQWVTLFHSCFVLNDSYSISVFREPGILNDSIERVLLTDSNEKIIYLEKGVF